MDRKLQKAGANWVNGERFFNRENELAHLRERVREGTHTLLTAQRRMGKTSLVRELLRQLQAENAFETVFVDLEGAESAADAIAEIAAQAGLIRNLWQKVTGIFSNVLQGLNQRVEEVGVLQLKLKFRAGLNEGNWQHHGDHVWTALAKSDKPVVLAIDELPILLNRLLKDHSSRITPEGRKKADLFMSWLRRQGQRHRGQVTLVISGSIGLEPILRQANLSATANILTPLELPPWNHEIASACLGALAIHYKLELSPAVRAEMCRRLRCCVPHHVQQFFDLMHLHLNRKNRTEALTADVEYVYQYELLGAHGQGALAHYEERLKMVLALEYFPVALELLTEASSNEGRLTREAIAQYSDFYMSSDGGEGMSIVDLLDILKHDGYLETHEEGLCFVSGLLQDWWRARHGEHFIPIAER